MKLSNEEFITVYESLNRPKLREIKDEIKKVFGIDMDNSSIHRRLKRLKSTGLINLNSGVSVETGTVLSGISRYHKLEDGGVWVKSNVQLENQMEAAREAITSLCEEVQPVEPIPSPVESLDSDLTTFYPLPDLHIGLLIHGEESHHGQNWDTKIAGKWIKKAMSHLVSTAPKSKYAVITDLGDLFHAQDESKQTKSGHQLDVDGRVSKIVKAGYDIIRTTIDMALQKHEIVYFYSIEGNHADLAPIYLKAFLEAWYRDEPRVIINNHSMAQQYHIFGKNILMFSHGHQLRPANAAETLVADNANNFSKSEYRYAHFGHYHHNELKEGKLCTVEIHKNIIPQDVWAQSMGFRGSIGYAKSITYHSQYGETGRSIFNIKMEPEGLNLFKK